MQTTLDETINAKLVWDGGQVIVPSEMGTASPDQMQGTDLEQLGEVACRICYDSLGSGRSSPALHQHILEVKHTSVYEHATLTVEISDAYDKYWRGLTNRHGIWTESVGNSLQLTYNLRSILEWDRHTSLTNRDRYTAPLQQILHHYASQAAPMVVAPNTSHTPVLSKTRLVPADEHTEHQAWLSLYLSGSRGMCYDDQTEVLTLDGWKPFREVNITSDQFATLNQRTQELEYQYATARLDQPYDGAMYRLKSQMVDLMVTPSHRMLIQKHDTQAAKRREESWQVSTAADIYRKRVKYKKNARWVGKEASHYSVGNKSHQIEPFLQMLGYWLSEGWLEHSAGGSYQISISQNIGPTLDKILDCVRRLGYSPSIGINPGSPESDNRIVTFCDKDLYTYLLGHCSGGNTSTCYTKRIPEDIKALSSTLLAVLVRTIVDGDGHVTVGGRQFMLGGKTYTRRGGHEVVYTTSGRLADDLQEIALKMGVSASKRVDDRVGVVPSGALLSRQTGKAFAPTVPCYIVSFACAKRQTPLVNHNGKRHDSFVPYTGRIYCVTVPNGLLYVRRNGVPVWSGNSHEQVRHGNETAISQRSTRYVNESDAHIVEHPLISQYFADRLHGDNATTMANITKMAISNAESACKDAYRILVGELGDYIAGRGVSKTDARKQARGAARNLLPNGMQTEMIFSASAAQWKWMLLQRCSQFADAEIRVMYNPVLRAIKSSRYGKFFDQFQLAPSPDGIGSVLA